MPDTFLPVFGTRSQAARFEHAARRGLADQAAEHRAELAEHAADLGAILGWLVELGAKRGEVSDAAGILLDAITDADHALRADIDAAGDDAEALDLDALRQVAGAR